MNSARFDWTLHRSVTFCCKTSSSSPVQSQATAVTNSKTRQNKEQSQGRDCKTCCTAQDKNTPRLTATPPTHFKMGFFKNASKCLTLQPGRVMLTPRSFPALPLYILCPKHQGIQSELSSISTNSQLQRTSSSSTASAPRKFLS